MLKQIQSCRVLTNFAYCSMKSPLVFLMGNTLQIVSLVHTELVANHSVIVQRVVHAKLTQEYVVIMDSVIQIGLGSTVKVIMNLRYIKVLQTQMNLGFCD